MDGLVESISAAPNVKGGDVLYTVHFCSTAVHSAFALLPAAVLIDRCNSNQSGNFLAVELF